MRLKKSNKSRGMHNKLAGTLSSIKNYLIKGMKVIKADEWIALLALLVSVVSIYLSVQQFNATSLLNARQQEQSFLHDRLSVKPLIQFNLEYTTASSWVGVSIINKGIGPAIIVKTKKYYTGKFLENWEDLTSLIENDKHYFWKEFTPYWIELKEGQAILPNDEIKLWFTNSNNISDYKKADTVLNN